MAKSITPAKNDVEVIVAGAGVIGLAIARTLALSGRDVMVLGDGRCVRHRHQFP